MSEILNIPGPARIASGAFVAGAGLVGLAWVITSRTPMPPPPNPEPVVLWPEQQTEPQNPQPEPARVSELLPAQEKPDLAPAEPSPKPESEPEQGPSIIPVELDEAPGPSELPQSPINRVTDSEHPEQEEPPTQEPEPDDSSDSAVQLISINSAGPAEMQLLPGIGPVLAQRIIADRDANGRFGSLNDLQRVKGIGVKTAAKLAPLISFD